VTYLPRALVLVVAATVMVAGVPAPTPSPTQTPSAPPNAPSNLDLTGTDQGNLLTWQDNSSDEGEFVIERSVSTDLGDFVPYAEIGSVPADTATFLDDRSYMQIAGNRDACVTAAYRVRAVNAAGASTPSNEVTTTLCVFPLSPIPTAQATPTATQQPITLPNTGRAAGR
jgi:hypothetical protein